jgi:phenylacetate-CoA ligase
MERATGHAWGFDRALQVPTIVRALKERECRYLNRNPTVAHILALECERLGIELKLDCVLAQGEHVDDDDRAAIARVFGASTIETYSSKEGGQMAHPCPHGTLHVNEEAVLMEILDTHGQPCSAHEPGRVVITPLNHTVQPLIRYELGDVAERGMPCPCGRHSMTLRNVLGRTTQMFRHPDGRAMLPILSGTSGKKMLDCTQWQIAQIGPIDFEVRYVPRSEGSIPDTESFTALFREAYFKEARLRLRRMSQILPAPSGKYIEYTNEFRAPGT